MLLVRKCIRLARENQRHFVLLALLVILTGVPYLAIAFGTLAGRPIAPLDDAYITLQYARQIAQGHPYQYNGGERPTTGMTSPLFGFLMAGCYLLGFTGERLVGLAVGLGPVWLGGMAWLTYRLASRLIGERAPRWWSLVAAALVLLTGSVQWASFNGMETGLFAVLTLAALEAFFAQRIARCALWLGLAALTRPEGLILAGLVWGVFLVEGLARRRTVLCKTQALLFVAILAGFLPSLINWALTGTASAAGLEAKSWLLNVPCYPEEIARSISYFYRRIVLGNFFGWAPSVPWFVAPGLFLFAILGWIGLGIRRRWVALLVTLPWFLAGTLSTATLITATWHEGRYQVPFVPVVVVLAICGLAFFQKRVARRWQRALLVIVVLFLAVSSLYSTLRFLDSYRRAVSTVARQQLVLADWIRENLPVDARVGVHDTGSLRYVGERPTYDLIGLTTAGATLAWRHGSGSVFEQMEHSSLRPDYFATYPDVFSIPYLAATDLFAEELFRVEVPDYAVASASATQGVWRADWRLAGSGERFYQPDVQSRTAGLRLVDALDVADLDDEAANNVEWWQDARRTGFPTEVQQLAYHVLPGREVLDGGRLLTGGIAFDVATRPGEALWIVARLHAREGGAVRVEVDGRDVGRWRYPPVPGEWLETIFHVPAEMIAKSQTRVALVVDADNPDFLHYAPYYFWFLQGTPPAAPAEVERSANAVFADDLSLLGFDLLQTTWHPGETIQLTLYWQALEMSASDAKVFVHLYDAQGELGPQSDGWAYHGTRPPYSWAVGEIITDSRPLTLPMDILPGTYSVEVGLYQPNAGRLPAYVGAIRQHEDRVQLAMIEVVE
ncbi:MAG: hypothetical protein JW918_14805 [Anaerolineae bacterium]|nr:hypothetical protein [Anaerolineae bacterium]